MTLKKMALSIGLLLVMVSTGEATTTMHWAEDFGTVKEVDAITTYNTTGYDMIGMNISVSFYNTAGATWTEDATWSNGPNHAGAIGADWDLYIFAPAESTFLDNYWIFETETDTGTFVSSILLEGFDANVIFDNLLKEQILSPPLPPSLATGTLGSQLGNQLSIDTIEGRTPPETTFAGHIWATYKDAVALPGMDPYGDVYQNLLIEFNRDGGNGFASTDEFYFIQDTDNIIDPIPEPATVLLFGVGLAGILGAGMRNRKDKLQS